MKYVMKHKWFSMGTGFSICDEKGRQAYHIDGSAFSFGKKLSFRDADDTELAFISQKMLSWGPTFEIYHGEDLQAVIRKDLFSMMRCKFTVDVGGPDDLHAEGDFGGHEYAFTREGRLVGRVSKGWFGTTGKYGVDVGPGEDELLLLAGAAVIDLCCHDGAKAGRARATVPA